LKRDVDAADDGDESVIPFQGVLDFEVVAMKRGTELIVVEVDGRLYGPFELRRVKGILKLQHLKGIKILPGK